MTGKYIVELKDRETLYKAAVGGNGEPYISTAMKNVYKEPDIEAIRDEAYEKGVQDTKQHWVDAPRSCAYQLGYENGLKAAWDAARKIESLSAREFDKAFTGYDGCFKVFENYTPQEAIEKIKQCGQGQEEIEYGDEIQFCDGVKALVLDVDDEKLSVVTKRGFTDISMWKGNVTKTGEKYIIIADYLRKIRDGYEF